MERSHSRSGRLAGCSRLSAKPGRKVADEMPLNRSHGDRVQCAEEITAASARAAAVMSESI